MVTVVKYDICHRGKSHNFGGNCCCIPKPSETKDFLTLVEGENTENEFVTLQNDAPRIINLRKVLRFVS